MIMIFFMIIMQFYSKKKSLTFLILLCSWVLKVCDINHDRISELPDEILAIILSLFRLKELVATSVLSRRWRYVWASTTTTLDIDCHDFDQHFKKNTPENLLPLRYLKWVDSILEQHKGPKIDHFRVSSFMTDRNYGFIKFYHWIQFAMEKRVERLELDFNYNSNSWESYCWPRTVSNLKDSSKSLKVLDLNCVNVSGEFLEYILSCCPVLERLKVWDSKDLVRLRVAGESLALKHLEIESCTRMERLEICGANQLVSLCLGWFYTCELQLENVPKLVDVSIRHFLFLRRFTKDLINMLSCCLSQLRILKLHINREDFTKDRRLEFPVLMTNLKHLELDNVNPLDYWFLLHLDSFMKASPHLEKLVLKLSSSPCHLDWKIEYIKVDHKYPHDHLKELEILGYSGAPNEIEIVRYFVENAVAVEKFTSFSQTSSSHMYNGGRSIHAIDQLIKTIIPSTVEFKYMCRCTVD